MAMTAFAAPIIQGKTEELRQWCAELAGPRREEYLASRRRLGVTSERAYLQQTPQGDIVVIVVEAEDLPRYFQGMATSQEPFDVWFRERVQDLHGLDLTQPSLPNELIFGVLH
jgi:hypothetical protein